MFKKYLQLTRAHTVPLEAVPSTLGAALAYGTFYNWHVLGWLAVGILYHLSGYGSNSVEDWKNGYDKDDPNKQHHPLNDGRLSLERAEWTVYILLALAIALAVFLIGFSPFVLAYMVGAALVAYSYNAYGKEMGMFKPVPVTIAHTSVFVLPFVASGGNIDNPIFILSTIYVLCWVFYQIAVSGDIKDIDQDETGLLSRYVTYKEMDYSDDLIDIKESIRLSFNTFKFISLFVAIVILSLESYNLRVLQIGTAVSISFLMVIIAYFNGRILSTHRVDRDRDVRYISAIEAITLVVFVLALSEPTGLVTAWLLIPASFIWVIVFNRIQWGTTLSPKV